MDTDHAVEVRGLKHYYGQRAALAGIDFQVHRGEIFGLLGPNGGGKSTTFRILSTLMVPSAGSAEIFGYDVVGEPGAVRRHIGVVFQSPSLDKKLSVRENLRHQGHLYGLRGADLKRRISEVLSGMRLSDRAGEMVQKLSGGLARRVELAKGVLHRPRLLLLDEPSTGLDPVARRDVWRQLEQLREKLGITVLMTTHIMEEANDCDRIAILDRGKIVALDSPANLRAEIQADCLIVETSEPGELCAAVREKFGGDPVVVDGHVRIERKEGHRFVAQLAETFPGRFDAVRVGTPTLEDVFIHRTGHQFDQEGEGPDE